MPDLNPNPTPQEVARDMLAHPDIQYSPEAYRKVIRVLLADSEALAREQALSGSKGGDA